VLLGTPFKKNYSRFCPEVGSSGGDMAQTMYTHVSKFKNYKK
jgi:hypothetical protein